MFIVMRKRISIPCDGGEAGRYSGCCIRTGLQGASRFSPSVIGYQPKSSSSAGAETFVEPVEGADEETAACAGSEETDEPRAV